MPKSGWYSLDAMSRFTESTQPSARFGPFDVYDVVGEGAMGVVYRALDRESGDQVAVKILKNAASAKPKTLSRFEREARSAAAIHHPGIIPVCRFGKVEDQSYFSMPYFEGPSLMGLLERGLPLDRFLLILIDICRALDAAHAKGIVHRDIKPTNILMGRDGRPVITDFGLAKVVQASKLTESGTVLGTATHMSPEQAFGRSKYVDGRADVYSVGVMLYQGLTGRVPFYAPTAFEYYHKIRSEAPVPPSELDPEVPDQLEAICLKTLEKWPQDRYPTAAALADDLSSFLGLSVETVDFTSKTPTLSGGVPGPGTVVLDLLLFVGALMSVAAMSWTLSV